MIAARKRVKRETENFESISEDDWPRVFVIVWNEPDQQVIAIENRIAAFKTTNSLAKTLEKSLNTILFNYNLNTQINPIFDQQSFWEQVEGKKIEKVIFKMVTPNMAAISKSLSQEIKTVAKMSNSATTEFTLNSPENGTLNISPEMNSIAGLVEYSSKGGGTIKFRCKGVRNTVDMKTKHSILTIEEVEIERYPSTILDRIKAFFK